MKTSDMKSSEDTYFYVIVYHKFGRSYWNAEKKCWGVKHLATKYYNWIDAEDATCDTQDAWCWHHKQTDIQVEDPSHEVFDS